MNTYKRHPFQLCACRTTWAFRFPFTWRPELDNGGMSIRLGVNNVLDEDPPECYSCALNGFDATLYDVPGQFVYLRLDYFTD